MKKDGFTLIEIMASITIGTILVLAISGLFIEAYHVRDDVKKTADLTREAAIAMNHMTRVLRFAKANSPVTVTATQISATIERGNLNHLNFITADTDIIYSIDANHNLVYTQGAASTTIAHNVTSFAGSLWDDTNSTLTINFTVADADPQRPLVPDVPLHTAVRVLGE